jgi:hypothetical protein
MLALEAPVEVREHGKLPAAESIWFAAPPGTVRVRKLYDGTELKR